MCSRPTQGSSDCIGVWNGDDSARTCGNCGHVKPAVPDRVLGLGPLHGEVRGGGGRIEDDARGGSVRVTETLPLRRRRQFSILKELPNLRSLDEFPLTAPEIDPQVHVSIGGR